MGSPPHEGRAGNRTRSPPSARPPGAPRSQLQRQPIGLRQLGLRHARRPSVLRVSPDRAPRGRVRVPFPRRADRHAGHRHGPEREPVPRPCRPNCGGVVLPLLGFQSHRQGVRSCRRPCDVRAHLERERDRAALAPGVRHGLPRVLEDGPDPPRACRRRAPGRVSSRLRTVRGRRTDFQPRLGMGFRRSGSGPRPRTPTHAEAAEGVAMIEALGLTRAYDGLRAVDDLTLEVPKGSVFGFLGRNGAGKTTTVKMLSTVLYPTAGTAAVAGFDIRNEALKVRSIIGVIGEGTELARPFWTPMEYLRFFSRLQSGSTGALGEELKEWLARLDLADHANRPIGGFSAGMRKRLELCRVFLRHPEVLLLDEPTKELDIPGKREIWELLRDLATKEKVT
ncbi:MAG: ABC transporter ATP-binding protein, partial [Methanobacteriota archaeon]